MKILLIDVDSRMPNLALMQISAYYKAKGHDAGFNIIDPDKVYISCIFKKNGAQARGIATGFPDAEIHIGGSGVNYTWLPEEWQKIKPNYDLYPNMDYSLGFATRGCFRNCEFCIVPEKEGKLHRWQHPREFHDERFKNMKLLDNNILGDNEWFFNITKYIIENKIAIDFTQGLDVRLLTKDIAERLKQLKWDNQIHFAFDNLKDEKAVKHGVKLLKRAGINIRSTVMFYVLVGYKSTEEEDKYRCRLLKELGTNPFVMKYVNNKWTYKISRWANRKQTFWSCDIDDYDHSKQRVPPDDDLEPVKLQSRLIK